MMKKLLFYMIAHLSVLVSFAQHDHAAPADRPSTHGMMVFGTHRIYASHLPMFHNPHNYQVILEIKLSDEIKAAYLAEREKFPQETIYTLEPENFVLPEMIGNPRPFQASLYRGHFERGGTKFSEQVTVSIVKVIYFKKFDPAAHHDNRHYLLFGNEKELFMAHRIEAHAPNYDHISAVEVYAGKMEVIKGLGKNPYLTFSLAGTQKNKLKPNEPGYVVRVKESNDLVKERFTLSVTKTLYLEFDDLKK